MILLRRYVVPAAATAVLYVLFGVWFGVTDNTYAAGLIGTLLTVYYIRFCDDLLDYRDDAERGKALLNKPWLCVLAAATALGATVTGFVTALPLFALPIAVISTQFLFKEPLRTFVKPLFLPALFAVLFGDVFVYDPWMIAITAVAVVADAVLVMLKRRSST